MTHAGPPLDAWLRLATPRRRAACMVTGAVLLAHALLLGSVARAPGPGARAQPPRMLQVRQITPSPVRPIAPAATEALPPRSTATVPARPPSVARRPPAAPAQAGPAAPVAAEPTADTVAHASAMPERPSEASAPAVPVYATRLPPPVTLNFALQRGRAAGEAELDWRAQETGYELTLRSQIQGAQPLAWASRGGFDGAGVAPRRYTESRRGREVRAANFQRGHGLVTFSGPSVQFPIVAGAQDRMSWMVQLAAVVAADPARAAAGAPVLLWVVGTRGDAEVWTFTAQGTVALDLPIGRVDAAVHLTREPSHPYDTRAEVWLDPARHHLPVRVSMRVHAAGEVTLLELQQARAR